MQQIITMGGGGFSMETTPALDKYVIAQTGVERPKVCFLAQASGESLDYTVKFYRAFTNLGAIPSHLSLFSPHTADIEDFLMSQQAIYVGGGNTKSMLALWREWGLDTILRKACESGVVLAGISAGCICWYDYGSTDSIPGAYRALRGLGYLQGGCSPHYDGEPLRRPRMHQMVAAGEIPAGYAYDDGAAGHFIDGKLSRVVSSRPNAKGYWIERDGDAARETTLETHYLGDGYDA
jgi:peptidase E